MGFAASSSTEPRASRIAQAGEFIKNFFVAAKGMAESFVLHHTGEASSSALLVTVQEAPQCLQSWKESSARHGVRMAFSAIKSIYKEVNIPYCSKGLSATNNHGEKNDAASLWAAMAGYDQSVVKLCNLNQMLEAVPRPPIPPAAQAEASEEEEEDDDESSNSSSEKEEEDQEDDPPKSPAA